MFDKSMDLKLLPLNWYVLRRRKLSQGRKPIILEFMPVTFYAACYDVQMAGDWPVVCIIVLSYT